MDEQRTQSGESSDAISVLILCIYQDLAEPFLRTIGVDEDGCTSIENRAVSLDVLAGDPRLNPGWDEMVKNADSLATLVRFLDVISLDKIKAIYRRLPSDRTVPMTILLFREEGEIDFKMSCPFCGQKIWVRDTDVSKRGRCPNCKKAFQLPSQAGHLKSQLMLPDNVPIIRVVDGNAASCRGAIANLMAQFSGEIVPSEGEHFDPETLKRSTVRVHLQNEEGS